MHGGDDLLQLGFGVGGAHEAKNVEGLVGLVGGDQPARAAWDAIEHDEEEDGGEDGDAELPPPLGRAKVPGGDDEVRQIRKQDADDDVDLEGADHAAAPLGGGELCDVDRAEDRGAADADAADEAGDHEDVPVPGEGAADGGDEIEDGHDAQGLAAADLLAESAGGHSTEDGAEEADGDGEAERGRREAEDGGELLRGAGDDGGVKAEEQTAQRADRGGFQEVLVHDGFSDA